uniref:Olfactory receptor 10A2-like n=1 Tax=Pelodiscus sinensis TaxID=13735 RepID=K7FSE2_PELSI
LMEAKNQTTAFVMVGLVTHPELQSLLFVVTLVMYVVSLVGNTLISAAVCLDSALHTPMHYFISSLSWVDICYTTVTIPKMLESLLSQGTTISFTGCAAQLYFLDALGTAECFLLAAMAYDRLLAICHPLRYAVLMSTSRCAQLVVGSWASSLLLSLGQTLFIFTLPFCGEHRINHFFCDVPPLLGLACGDTTMNEVAVFVAGMGITLIPSMLIVGSYLHIIATVLKIKSAQGRRKAFSTCSSHLLVITLFYGSASAMYLRPKSTYAPESDKFLALLYCVVTPTLNPIIYSLRSKDINQAVGRVIAYKILRRTRVSV